MLPAAMSSKHTCRYKASCHRAVARIKWLRPGVGAVEGRVVNSSEGLQGFVLTRHWRDTSVGTEIELWVATEAGPRKLKFPGQTSVAFAAEVDRAQIEPLLTQFPQLRIDSLALKDFHHRPVVGIYSQRYRQLLNLERVLKDKGVSLFEADIRPPERYLMERFLTASISIEGGTAEGITITDAKLRAAPQYRPSLRAVSLDIETSAHGDLYSIALEGCGERQVYMLGEPPTDPPQVDFQLQYCATRREILERLNLWFNTFDPDIVIGWNLIQFDLRILQAHADKYRIPLLLGRGGKPIEWRGHGRKEGYLFAATPGRLMIDGIEALKSAVWSFESFSLENVARSLLGEGKLATDAYNRMEEIEQRFRHDKPALARYNLRDCELVTRIFAKTNLMEFLVERANVTGLQADHFGGSIAAFNHHYLPRMHRLGYVAPNVGDLPGETYPGGFVMDSRPGIYDSVLVLDYKSLYPSIIRTFLVDPVGLVEAEVETDKSAVVPGVNGVFFSRTRHSLPAIVTELWNRRDIAKREKNQPLSQALKLLMNSFSGVLGSPDCKFFNSDLVSSITLRGHQIMAKTRELVEGFGYKVIYGDTDSIFIWLEQRLMDGEALAVGESLAAKINEWWTTDLADTLQVENALEIEVDTFYSRFFMPTTRGTDQGSKKRYAGLTRTADGSEDIVFRGLETARSDWTLLAQRFQQELYLRVFRREPYQDFIRQYVRDTREGKLDELMVYKKRLRHPLRSYEKNVPPQVRAARLADAFNAKQQRPLQYQNGGRISYVMTLNGPEPLEALTSTIDYEHYVAKQLQPIADAILHVLHDDFDALTNTQTTLF
jgi:DNA polymerase-2